MDNEHIHDGESEGFGPDYITLVDEDGKEYTMEFLDSIDLDGKQYLAFCDADVPEDAEAIEVSIFRVETNDDDTEELVGLDDEEELERVYEAFLDQQPDDEDDGE